VMGRALAGHSCGDSSGCTGGPVFRIPYYSRLREPVAGLAYADAGREASRLPARPNLSLLFDRVMDFSTVR